MNNYNDFQVLSEEQYLNIYKQFTNNNQALRISLDQLFCHLNQCINSLKSQKNNYNIKLQQSIANSINTLEQAQSIFKILYPNLKCGTTLDIDNIFTILSTLLEIEKQIRETILKSTKKQLYTISLTKVCKCIHQSVIDLLTSCSKSKVRFYKYQ